jgi:hypothetical protein
VKIGFALSGTDGNNAAQAAAHVPARRLRAGGLAVAVEVLQVAGWEWNDVHQQSRNRQNEPRWQR